MSTQTENTDDYGKVTQRHTIDDVYETYFLRTHDGLHDWWEKEAAYKVLDRLNKYYDDYLRSVDSGNAYLSQLKYSKAENESLRKELLNQESENEALKKEVAELKGGFDNLNNGYHLEEVEDEVYIRKSDGKRLSYFDSDLDGVFKEIKFSNVSDAATVCREINHSINVTRKSLTVKDRELSEVRKTWETAHAKLAERYGVLREALEKIVNEGVHIRNGEVEPYEVVEAYRNAITAALTDNKTADTPEA